MIAFFAIPINHFAIADRDPLAEKRSAIAHALPNTVLTRIDRARTILNFDGSTIRNSCASQLAAATRTI